MSLWRAIGVPLICGLITVGIGAINIWAGVLALPIMYGLAEVLLSKKP
jgi:hypothetical protein